MNRECREPSAERSGPAPKRRRGKPKAQADPQDESTTCLICNQQLEGPELCYVVTGKGLGTVRNASKERGDDVGTKIAGKTSVQLHSKCRSDYTHPAYIAREKLRKTSESVKNLRSASIRTGLFDPKVQCIMCGNECKDVHKLSSSLKRHRRQKVSCVETIEKFEMRLNEEIDKRREITCQWSAEVKSRRDEVLLDFPSAEVRYHRRCFQRFIMGRKLDGAEPGRPAGQGDRHKEPTFEILCNYLKENDECQFSVDRLIELMEEIDCESTYTRKWLLQKLQGHFGDGITITYVHDKAKLVNFSGFADKVLFEKWHSEQCEVEADEKRRIVKLAARFVLEEIRSKPLVTDEFPDDEAIFEQHTTDLLKLFLETVVTTKASDTTAVEKKRECLGQALMLQCRPKSFSPPALLSIAASLHRAFASRDLLDKLHAAGFLPSYDEVRRFEFSKGVDAKRRAEAGPQETAGYSFVHDVWDNVDWNAATLDGHGTLHRMAGARLTTPTAPRGPRPSGPAVPRLPLPKTAAEFAAAGSFIPLRKYVPARECGLSTVAVNVPSEADVTAAAAVKKVGSMDALFLAGRWSGVPLAPSWSGFNKAVMAHDKHRVRQPTDIEMLPIINMEATSMTAIYTALQFSAEHARAAGQDGCFVTFDNGLYPKASKIVASDKDLKNFIVPRLGGFHLLMTFMGVIGDIMEGSGLDDVWGQVHAPNSVVHMLSGKAFKRALRAHLLTQEGLVGVMLDADTDLDDATKATIRDIHTACLEGSMAPAQLGRQEAVRRVETAIQRVGERAANTRNRTALLWWLYFVMVEVMKKFLRAERLGEWQLHLNCIRAMEPFFYCTGHYLYAKWTRHYVQAMEGLQGGLLQAAQAGLFAVWRSAEAWSGMPPDLIVEQCVMRPIKSRGGIVHRGLTDSVLSQWWGTAPALRRVLVNVEMFLGVHSTSSEQHVDLRESRRKIDADHLDRITSWLKRHDPFQMREAGIWNISTGVPGSERVNCDEAERLGREAMAKLEGQNFAGLSVTRKGRIITLADPRQPAARKQQTAEVTTTALFFRLLFLLAELDKKDKATEQDKEAMLRECLAYELAAVALALFDKNGLMNHGTKSDFVPKLCPPEAIQIGDDEEQLGGEGEDERAASALGQSQPIVIVDGGYLLHVVIWPRSERGMVKITFRDIFKAILSYCLSKFSRSGVAKVVVVFDGYETRWSTKAEEHRRRELQRGKHLKPCPDIYFDENTTVDVDQEAFLGNVCNKTKFIKFLKRVLEGQVGVEVRQAQGDADVLIAETAIEAAASSPPPRHVSVVANDTDILVLLAARAEGATNIYVVHPGSRAKPTKRFNIKRVRDWHVQSDTADLLLACYAFDGCDDVSHIYGVGKGKLLEKAKKCPALRTVLRKLVGADPDNLEEVAVLGEKIFLALYPGGDKAQSLNDLRFTMLYKKLQKRTALLTKMNLATLCPTSAAARQHSFRAFLKIREWSGREVVDPTTLGWDSKDGTLVPVPYRGAMAPAFLLEKASCGCTTGCREGSRCSCRTAREYCSPACSNCSGQDCTNSPQQDNDMDWDLDDF